MTNGADCDILNKTEVLSVIYRPMYVDRIMAYVDTPFVKILTGVRRCGKSTILRMIIEKLKTERNIPDERIVTCWFDSMEFDDMTSKQMYNYLKEKIIPGEKTYLFLDEVQEITNWEKVVNSLASDFASIPSHELTTDT